MFWPAVKKVFCRLLWSGNILELQHAVEHAMIMGRDNILLPNALPEHIFEPNL